MSARNYGSAVLILPMLMMGCAKVAAVEDSVTSFVHRLPDTITLPKLATAEPEKATSDGDKAPECKTSFPSLYSCPVDVPIDVTPLDAAYNSYMLVAHPAWFDIAATKDKIKQAFADKGREFCGERGVENLIVNDPEYLGSNVSAAPRAWLYCQKAP